MGRTYGRRLAFLITILCAATTASGQQPAPEATPAESRAITGRVVSESGQPLAGASVSAFRSNGSSGPRTATNSEGYFNLQGLDPGFYRLSANLPGYVVQIPQLDPTSAPLYRPGDSASLTLIKGGVITGVVTDIAGEPLVNVSVRALRIRDAEGNRIRLAAFAQPRLTDDRGSYRIYGLPPGTYIVAAGGPGQYFGFIDPYTKDAPTYAPASTRDTAAEFVVRSDQEVTSDIRYRGEPGHAISGKVTGALPQAAGGLDTGAGVRLSDIESHTIIITAPVTGDDRAFQLNGISDGEYEITALGGGGGPNPDLNVSAPRRVIVRGADVTGLTLVLAPLGSITGRIIFETDQKLNCGRRRDNAMRETMILVRRERIEEKAATQRSAVKGDEYVESALFPTSLERVPNEKGEINMRNLIPGTYRFEVRLPGAGWYTRELTLDQPDQKGTVNRAALPNIARNGIVVKSGDKPAVTITITEGGAGLRGRVVPAEGQNVPPTLKLYLVPAEREHAENVLRFFEAAIAADGTFAMGNIGPGRYWIIARPGEAIDANTLKSIKSDSALRAKVLRDAEALKKEISFKPCERTVDYELSFSPTTSKQ
jgi:Carboxypeptidase regulatory-like domain